MIDLASPSVRLAPMAGVTNAPFRLVTKECGNPLVTSEEIDAKALCLGRHSPQAVYFLKEEHPIAMQLLGSDPTVLAEAAKKLEEMGADLVDLNMGCPVPKIVKKGQGAALMRDPVKAAAIFRAMRKAIKVPMTVKIRGGWDERSLNAPEIARIAEAVGLDGVTVHPRTRSQLFTGRAPWGIIADVVAAVRIPVTGNGDIRSRADALRMISETGCRSVMVGRGALGHPWIFDAAYEGLEAKEQREYRFRVISRHRGLIMEHLPDPARLIHLKKNLVWYAAGTRGSATVRRELFLLSDPAAVWERFLRYWHGAGNWVLCPHIFRHARGWNFLWMATRRPRSTWV